MEGRIPKRSKFTKADTNSQAKEMMNGRCKTAISAEGPGASSSMVAACSVSIRL